MKTNSLFTSLICILLTLIISAGQLLYCIHSTIMSSRHFSDMLDNDIKLSQLTTLVYSGLSQPVKGNESQTLFNRYALGILNRVDQAWVKGQIYIGATGIHKYLSSEATTLPTLDFVPLNAAIRETLVAEAMRQPQTKESVEKVKTVLAVLNNKYLSATINFGLNNQAIAMLLELSPIRSTGFDRTALLEIIRIYLSFSNKSTTIDQASVDIVKRMTAEALELNKLRDYFDMNLFVEKTFGDSNPFAQFKTMLHRIDTSTSITINILFWCLILLLIINIRFKLLELLRHILLCTAAAAAINLLLSGMFINPVSSNKLFAQFDQPVGAFDSFISKLLVFLFRDLGVYLALQSALIIIIAAVLYLIIKMAFRKSKKQKTKTMRLSTWRFTAVILIFILLSGWWSITSISRDINDFQSNLVKLQSTDIEQSITNGLIEAGGMDFLKYAKKKAVPTAE